MLNSYEKRLLRDLEDSVAAAKAMLEHKSNDARTELMVRLPNIRTQCQQAANYASELYGAMSSEAYAKKG